MRGSWRAELPHWIVLGAMFALGAATWPNAPDRVPVHWGLGGEPDRYGGKVEGLLLLPAVALGVYVLARFLPRFDPRRENYEQFSSAYSTFRLGLTAVMAGVYGVLVLAIRGTPVRGDVVLPFVLGGFLVLIGNLMGKLRPNWFIGIRTPWTLSSNLSWVKTHRLGAWWLFLSGLVLMGFGVVREPWVFWSFVALALGGCAGLAVYSYRVWRSDPDKVPPRGTLPA